MIFTDIASEFVSLVVFNILLIIFGLLLQTLVAINTHRIILLGPDSVPKWGLIDWSMRETSFTLYVLLMSLVAIPLAIFVLIPPVGFIITIGIYSVVFTRWSLVLPSTAIDKPIGLKGAWQLSSKHSLYLFTVVFVFPIIFAVLLFSPIYLLPDSDFFIAYVSLATALITIFGISNLSVAYSHIANKIEDHQTS